MMFLGSTAFCSDILKPTTNDNINAIDVMNFIIGDLFVTSNTNYNSEIFKWDVNTILWAEFKGNLLAGNIQIPIDSITSIRIKVREYGDTLWRTISEFEINTAEDFDFSTMYYYLKGNKTKYEVAIVPVLNGSEANYITNSVISDFDGCYLCTKYNQYHAFINLLLEATTNKNKEFITTLGRKKPFAISNGISQYDTISMNASFIPINVCELDIDGAAMYRKEVNKFLTESPAMIIKDDKGNRWMVSVGNTVVQSVDGHPDNIVYNIDFTEVGDCDSTIELFNAGLSDVDVEGV